MLKHVISLLLVVFVLSGCKSKEEQLQETIDQQVVVAQKSLERLSDKLQNGTIRNAMILEQYADWVKRNKSEFSALAEQLALDAKPSGPLYQSLQERLNDASSNNALFTSKYEQLDELKTIAQGASANLFNDALSDPVNVLADMSNGALPRVNAMSRAAEISNNPNADMGVGSQLIGNPQYGQWSTGSNGMSFWEWYGMYSLFSNMFRGPVYYDRWSSHRGYSYYNDYGRSRYTSPKQAKRQNEVYKKTKLAYQKQNRSFKSPYAKKRTGATSLSRASRTPTKSTATRSSYSSSSGSMRSGNSRTSRGFGRGK